MNFFANILQISSDTSQAALNSDELLNQAQETVNVIDIATKGGWIMLILLVLSVLAVYIFITRLMLLGNAQKNPEEMMTEIKKMIKKSDIEAAKVICRKADTPTSRMIESGLNNIGNNSIQGIEAAIENKGKIELYGLEKNISILATISGAAPMIGFFGTVLGMIQAFIAIAQEEGSVSPKLLSSGIYEAMVTTAGGLFVGIIAYISYNYIVRQISNVAHTMEIASNEFMNVLQNPE